MRRVWRRFPRLGWPRRFVPVEAGPYELGAMFYPYRCEGLFSRAVWIEIGSIRRHALVLCQTVQMGFGRYLPGPPKNPIISTAHGVNFLSHAETLGQTWPTTAARMIRKHRVDTKP